MDIVIIGCGKVGTNITAALSREGHNVTVIDQNPTVLQRIMSSYDVMGIEGNGATADVQLEASADKADLVIAVTQSDELNIMCCLIAKKVGAKRTIPRIRKPEYQNQTENLREELHLSMTINPELAGSSEILRVLTFPSAAKVELFGKGRLELVEYKIGKNSDITGYSLQEIYKKNKTKILICAVQRDNDVFIPDGKFVIQEGDRINIAASHKNIERFFRASGIMNDKIKSVMIVGGGTICYYLTKLLLKGKMSVKIIEKDPDRAVKLAKLLPDAIVINGDGTDQDLLSEEGIENFDAFVALIGIDEENIIISQYVKELTNVKVVTKIDRENYVDIATRFGLDCIVSPKVLTSGNVVSYVRSLKNTDESEIESLYHLVGNEVEAIEFRVSQDVPGLTRERLKNVKLKKNILICAIIRKNDIIIPDGESTVNVGDSVVLVTKNHKFSSLRDIVR